MHKLSYFVVVCALTTINAVYAANPPSMEQCYGIAKAGQNDCSDSKSCDKSVIDGDPNYFLFVPTGFCNRIVGGMLMPNVGISAPPASTTTTTVPTNTMPAPNTTMPSTPTTAPSSTAPVVPATGGVTTNTGSSSTY